MHVDPYAGAPISRSRPAGSSFVIAALIACSCSEDHRSIDEDTGSAAQGTDPGTGTAGDGDGDGDGDETDPGVCGDGEINTGEECDDGNSAADDGCTDCALDPCSVVTELAAPAGLEHDWYGDSVALWGDTAILRSRTFDSSRVHILRRGPADPLAWVEVAAIDDPSVERPGTFGASISLWNDTVVIGASGEDAGAELSGAAYVLERDVGGPDGWGEVARIVPPAPEEQGRFGTSVALWADTAAIGADREDAVRQDRGVVYVVHRDAGGPGAWEQLARLTPSDADDFDNFGDSVALWEDTLVVGAPTLPTSDSNLGSVYVFSRDEGGADQWGEVAKLVPDDASPFDGFGTAVAIWEDALAVGATGVAGGDGLGRVHVFRSRPDGSGWTETARIRPEDPEGLDNFGLSLTLEDDVLAVGAPNRSVTGAGLDLGAAYVFARDAIRRDGWEQIAKLVAPERVAGDHFGDSVAIAGSTLIVGQPGAFDGLESGAAYVHDACDSPD